MSADLNNLTPTKKKLYLSIVLLVLLIVGYIFGVSPMRGSTKVIQKQLDEQISKNDRVVKELGNVLELEAKRDELREYITTQTNEYVLIPELGSYPAQRIIYETIKKHNLPVIIKSAEDIGKVKTPQTIAVKNAPKKKRGKKAVAPEVYMAFTRFHVEVACTATFSGLVRLLNELELQNPYFSVLELTVVADDNKPESHNVVMRLEWPVKSDPPPVVAPVKGKK